MNKRIHIIIYRLCVVLFPVVLSAQESGYEQMRQQMTASSLPLVNLTYDLPKANTTGFIPAEIEISDPERRTDPANETVHYRCAVRYRGGSASGLAKKSFAIKLYQEDGSDLDAPIMGIREENSWILDAMGIDRMRMRNRLCFDVWNDLSRTPYETAYERRNGTQGVFVEVFVNGDYNGLYCLTDKIDRKLLGLRKAKVDSDGGVTIRGLMYKGITWGDYTDSFLLSYREAATDKDTWNCWELQYPDDYPCADAWRPLMDLIDFCSAKTPDEELATRYGEHFYPTNLADYIVFSLALNVGDNLYKNTFLSTVNALTDQHFLITPWDMDMSLGGNWNGAYLDELSVIDQYCERAPFDRLIGLSVEDFVCRLCQVWSEHEATLFSPDSICRRIDNYAERFIASGAWEREQAKWNGNPVPLQADIREEAAYVKDWYVRNHASLSRQFADFATSIASPVARNENPPAGIYTLDGRKVTTSGHLPRGIYIIGGRKVMR